MTYTVTHDPAILVWLHERIGGMVSSDEIPFGLVHNGKLEAVVALSGFNGHNITVAQAIDGRYVPPFFFWAVCDYVFKELNCGRMTAVVNEKNERALKVNSKLGFEQEARLSKASETGDDMIVMVMWKDSCKWLKLGERYEFRKGQQPT